MVAVDWTTAKCPPGSHIYCIVLPSRSIQFYRVTLRRWSVPSGSVQYIHRCMYRIVGQCTVHGCMVCTRQSGSVQYIDVCTGWLGSVQCTLHRYVTIQLVSVHSQMYVQCTGQLECFYINDIINRYIYLLNCQDVYIQSTDTVHRCMFVQESWNVYRYNTYIIYIFIYYTAQLERVRVQVQESWNMFKCTVHCFIRTKLCIYWF